MLTLTLNPTTAQQGDTVRGTAIATASYGLTGLSVTVLDDTIGSVVNAGTAFNASKLTAIFSYKVTVAVPGKHVRFRAVAYSFTGDSTVEEDTVHIVGP